MSEQSLVAVVDDDHCFRLSMRRLLESLGYPVVVFASAAEFLSSPALSATRCLVADVHMPAMTGIELYLHLVDTGPTISTILVTAYPDEDVADRMLGLGVASYLRKPLEEAALIDCLRAVFAAQ